jgi:uncharacterized membrane protein
MREIIFIHIFSVILWIGGMIILKFAVSPVLKNISDDAIKITKILEIMKRFFYIAFIASMLLIITAVILIIGLDLKTIGGNIYQIVMIKEIIWTVMFVILLFIILRRNRAKKYLKSNNIKMAIKTTLFIDKLIIVNIVLGLVSVYFGIILRGF